MYIITSCCQERATVCLHLVAEYVSTASIVELGACKSLDFNKKYIRFLFSFYKASIINLNLYKFMFMR